MMGYELFLILVFLSITGVTAYSQITPTVDRWLSMQAGVEP